MTQLIPRYLATNRTTIIANVAGFITEYKPVYQRNIKIYKNIDNILQFRVLNPDQKPLSISGLTPKFVAFDENKKLIIEHDGVAIVGDDSAATRGLFSVTIAENDLLGVDTQYLSYNIVLQDASNINTLTYSDTDFGNSGVMFVDSGARPGPSDSYSFTQFQQENVQSTIFFSESKTAEPAINGNDALHTASIYTSSYIGDVIAQATLDSSVTESTAWGDVATVTFTGAETTPIPVNFNGVFNHLRFKTTANPADKITKILVRN
jgi:hypothetical protein|tara:strand:- start:1210 stop:2001 length:792 start_codon:yes stop_codon:yes gene_type:complete